MRIQSPFLILGVVIWPLAVSSAMFFVGWKLAQFSSAARFAVISALLISTLLTVNLGAALRPPMSNLPTFYRLFTAVW